MFIAIKTDDGRIKGKISFYCKVLHVSRQAFNQFLKTKDAPWKYQALADAMIDILVNNAGFSARGKHLPLHEQDISIIDGILQTNL